MRFLEITPDDVPALFDVRVATRENRLSRDELSARGITESAVQQRLAGSFRGWLCACDGRVVGFAMGDGSTGELEVIAVLPEYEGRGVGRGLLERVERWLRSVGWNELWLLTDPDVSLRAYRFYRAAGWLDAGLDGGNRVLRKPTPGLR
jgi:GNAT superfamily N-acetyltransferase